MTSNVDGVSVFLKGWRYVIDIEGPAETRPMIRRLSLVLVTLAVALTACGSSEPPAPPPQQRKPTVFDPTTSTLDRAKGVQQTVDEQAAELRKKVEAAEK